MAGPELRSSRGCAIQEEVEAESCAEVVGYRLQYAGDDVTCHLREPLYASVSVAVFIRSRSFPPFTALCILSTGSVLMLSATSESLAGG